MRTKGADSRQQGTGKQGHSTARHVPKPLLCVEAARRVLTCTKAAFGAACGRREHRPEAASTVPRLETHRSCSSSRALCRSDSARCRRGCGVAETLGIASGGGVVPAA